MNEKMNYSTGLKSRENILLAARKCFAQKGFFETSMSDIQQAANTSRGVMYHHFESKDDMILVIIEENLGKGVAKIESDLVSLRHTGQGDLRGLLMSIIELAEQITFGPGKAMSLHVWSLAMLKPVVHQTVMGSFERLRQALKLELAEFQKLGKIHHDVDLERLATVLFSIQIPAYIVQRLFMDQHALEPQDFVDSLLSLFTFANA